MNPRILASLLFAAGAMTPPVQDQQKKFLIDNGWVPLGKHCLTGIEGWGKVIDSVAVTVDQPEALVIAGWK